MKKLILLAAVAVFAVVATSCKKDYTCTCTFEDGEKLVLPAGKTTKSKAKDSCSAAQTTYSNVDPKVSCSI